MTEPTLSISGLAHTYDGDVEALRGVDLTVAAGEIVCLVGPSGCGKSTLLRLAAGLEAVQQGEIRIAGRRVAASDLALPPEKRDVGLVFQDYALFPHLTVLRNVTFGLKGQSDARERALTLLEQVGLADKRDAYPHMLSGGQQQRVALARALAPGPKLMLLDEPFSGLDRALRQDVRDRTLHLLQGSGVGSLIVTHDPEEAMHLADRIALMRGGRIEQLGRPADVYLKPMTAFVAAFFGDVNRWETVVDATGAVATPFGAMASPLAPGSAVTVVLRPEAVRPVDPGEGQVTGRVRASRLLGRGSLLHLDLVDREGGRHHLHSRVPGLFLPEEGTEVPLKLLPEGTFVFPSEQGLT